MGNWRITIEGVGSHHNGPRFPEVDADRLAAIFVTYLKDAHHTLTSATFEVYVDGASTVERLA